MRATLFLLAALLCSFGHAHESCCAKKARLAKLKLIPDPNATAPTLDSIDSMDLMLLIEETTGQRLDAAPFDEHGPATWRALAAALAEPPSAGGGG